MPLGSGFCFHLQEVTSGKDVDVIAVHVPVPRPSVLTLRKRMNTYCNHRLTQSPPPGKGPVTFPTGTRGFHPQVWECGRHLSVGLCTLLPPQAEGPSPGGAWWGPGMRGGVCPPCPAGETTSPKQIRTMPKQQLSA